MTKKQMPITCSNCGTQYPTEVRDVIDVSKDAAAKQKIINGTLNNSQCPNCGTVNKIVTPLLYHDPGKELLIAMVPMEVNATKNQQEQIVGDLMNQLPKDNFKGYMFNPRRALTMNGLVEQILQADGVSPDEVKQQQAQERDHIEILQKFLEAQSEEAMQALIKEHDAEIDEQFFQTLVGMSQRSTEGGRPDVAQQLVYLQSALIELSTYGQQIQAQQQQLVHEVNDAVNELGAEAQREDFLDLALQYADSPSHLQTLVRLVRPVFDDDFFQQMNLKISQLPAQAREKVETLRERIKTILAALDQQAQANAVNLLQGVVNHPEPEALLRANIQMIDQNFVNVLQANIQHAESRGDVQTSARLKEIEGMVNKINGEMQDLMGFLRELIQSDEPEALLRANPNKINDNLLTILMLNIEEAQQSGETAVAQRLSQIYNTVVTIVQEDMKPELRFVNDLLTVEDDAQAKAMLNERIGEFGDELIEVMDAVEEMLGAQVEPALIERMKLLRQEAQKTLQA